ncbi:pentatricopeptide repeat-containing protein At2g13600-like [Mangifera indica]|uniref:pentatricopeptide repeat-containing protein At2g13600-like n=1 Tax=Mangifera indica TaxID=29780 RepID=UPI001CFB9864|nr:pentatricopeptide repeat-containing protein At2g13600-like [Mangifera indica]
MFPPSLTSTRLIPYYIFTRHITSSLNSEQLCSNLLQKCIESSSLLHGAAIHGNFIKCTIPCSLFLHNHILNMYMKCGDLTSGLQLFDEMPHRNVVSWSAVISGFVQHGFPQKALSTFKRMLLEGETAPNGFTFVSVLHACSLCESESGGLGGAYQIFGLILRLGLDWNVFLMNAFLTALIRKGKMVEASQVFDNCLNKDIVTWNAMMGGYLQHCYSEVPGFWLRMISEGVKPDNFTFSSVLTSLAVGKCLEMGMQVHGLIVKSGYGVEICVGNSLADMYIKNQRLAEGYRIFNEMPKRDVCSWTQMASGCLQCGEPGKAVEVVEEMMKIGVKPNKFTLATAFNACANLAFLEKGKKVHGLRIKLGSEIDVCVDNALLDMYVKCGYMDGAWGVFRSMDDYTVVSWTTMIMGCAQNGQAREALEIFEDMTMKGVEPNYITYICVLYACSQGGFIDEGWKYLSSMTKDHGISPGEDHYACMVNLLGRAGRTKEAEELILNLPIQSGVLIWQTLLAACQRHGDVETGKRAAEHAINLNRNDSSSYVLLSNMFADLNNWDGVGMLRQLMETRDVRKMPGTSWIE